MENPNLEFRKIKSLDFLYEVNGTGTIFRNVKSKKHLKIVLDHHHSAAGYYFTWICLKKKVRRVSIARVVAECWLGDRPEGYEIDHIDRNSQNNLYTNLRYVTRSEQMKNRDHSNISATGSQNLMRYIEGLKKPVELRDNDGNILQFESIAACSRYLSTKYDCKTEQMRGRLKARRSRIFDYDVIYRNAETKHAHSTE